MARLTIGFALRDAEEVEDVFKSLLHVLHGSVHGGNGSPERDFGRARHFGVGRVEHGFGGTDGEVAIPWNRCHSLQCGQQKRKQLTSLLMPRIHLTVFYIVPAAAGQGANYYLAASGVNAEPCCLRRIERREALGVANRGQLRHLAGDAATTRGRSLQTKMKELNLLFDWMANYDRFNGNGNGNGKKECGESGGLGCDTIRAAGVVGAPASIVVRFRPEVS